ncbi:hypothetical protein ACFLXO_07225 [Chloroflexota bacterium]
MQYFFEDVVSIGKKFISRGWTIGEGALVMLANLTWNITSLHADRESSELVEIGVFGDY